jgi:hypothetical protein
VRELVTAAFADGNELVAWRSSLDLINQRVTRGVTEDVLAGYSRAGRIDLLHDGPHRTAADGAGRTCGGGGTTTRCAPRERALVLARSVGDDRAEGLEARLALVHGPGPE